MTPAHRVQPELIGRCNLMLLFNCGGKLRRQTMSSQDDSLAGRLSGVAFVADRQDRDVVDRRQRRTLIVPNERRELAVEIDPLLGDRVTLGRPIAEGRRGLQLGQLRGGQRRVLLQAVGEPRDRRGMIVGPQDLIPECMQLDGIRPDLDADRQQVPPLVFMMRARQATLVDQRGGVQRLMQIADEMNQPTDADGAVLRGGDLRFGIGVGLRRAAGELGAERQLAEDVSRCAERFVGERRLRLLRCVREVHIVPRAAMKPIGRVRRRVPFQTSRRTNPIGPDACPHDGPFVGGELVGLGGRQILAIVRMFRENVGEPLLLVGRQHCERQLGDRHVTDGVPSRRPLRQGERHESQDGSSEQATRNDSHVSIPCDKTTCCDRNPGDGGMRVGRAMVKGRFRCGWIVLLIAIRGATAEPPSTMTSSSQHEAAHGRRPVAAAWLEPGRTCVVANRRSGTVSRIDLERRAVIDEQSVAARLADLARCETTGEFVVVDDKAHELITFCYDPAGRVAVTGRLAVSPYPTKVAIAPDEQTAAVACLWSRTIDVVALRSPDVIEPSSLSGGSQLRVVASIKLPFAPREVGFTPDGERLIVLDAFGGQVAAIDWRRRSILAVHTLDGHNLRGLAFDPATRTVAFAGQTLNSRLPTTAEHLRSGALMKNRLWQMGWDRLADPKLLAAAELEIVELDRPDVGAGDPNAIARTTKGQMLVALGGAARLAVVADGTTTAMSIVVGARPCDILLSPDETHALVVNQLSDSVSWVDLSTRQVVEIRLGPQPEPYPRDRGEQLFFDAGLSLGGTMSCHSCHPDGHTHGRTADTFGDGAYGNPKRVISLLGTSLTDQWAWNGLQRELRDQVRQSFETTMHGPTLRPEQHDDVVAFLHTLPLPPPLMARPRDAVDRELLDRGRKVFESWNCGQCHVGPLTYTSQGAYDVGLRDELGQAKFNPPTLRGVGHGAAYFHDNRAGSLEGVLQVYRHQVPTTATDDELVALARFLRSL